VTARLVLGLAVLALGGSPAAQTFGEAGTMATKTLVDVFYAGGSWRMCDQANCWTTNSDWGADSLTYALWLRWETTRHPAVPPVLRGLLATTQQYPPPCTSNCTSGSDVPEWDAIAAVREYQVLGDPVALADARAAFDFVEGSNAFALGACPEIRYQQSYGSENHLKTLETDSNAIKAALLLYQVTHERSYRDDAVRAYAAVRKWFFDPAASLYSVYVFDDGQRCVQVPHRFFASVNGNMIWSGITLAKLTGHASYAREALATGRAVARSLADPAGIFVDLQAENDIVEPLVEGMYSLAASFHASLAHSWILTNAAAAVSARAPDGAYGRFFDGPAPTTTVTAWQANGGLALQIAAAALDPSGKAATASPWATATRFTRELGLGDSVRIHGSEVAVFGSLGEMCCEAGHARVFVDGHETFDRTGIW
jgi:hypothetical protein